VTWSGVHILSGEAEAADPDRERKAGRTMLAVETQELVALSFEALVVQVELLAQRAPQTGRETRKRPAEESAQGSFKIKSGCRSPSAPEPEAQGDGFKTGSLYRLKAALNSFKGDLKTSPDL